jgi:hypothetical protein
VFPKTGTPGIDGGKLYFLPLRKLRRSFCATMSNRTDRAVGPSKRCSMTTTNNSVQERRCLEIWSCRTLEQRLPAIPP